MTEQEWCHEEGRNMGLPQIYKIIILAPGRGSVGLEGH